MLNSSTPSTASSRILEASPEAHEVLVEQVKLLRYAEVRGAYDQVIGVLDAVEERVR